MIMNVSTNNELNPTTSSPPTGWMRRTMPASAAASSSSTTPSSSSAYFGPPLPGAYQTGAYRQQEQIIGWSRSSSSFLPASHPQTPFLPPPRLPLPLPAQPHSWNSAPLTAVNPNKHNDTNKQQINNRMSSRRSILDTTTTTCTTGMPPPHALLRRRMKARIIHTLHERKPHASLQSKKRYPILVDIVENGLYLNAQSLEEYTCEQTLLRRLQSLAREVQGSLLLTPPPRGRNSATAPRPETCCPRDAAAGIHRRSSSSSLNNISGYPSRTTTKKSKTLVKEAIKKEERANKKKSSSSGGSSERVATTKNTSSATAPPRPSSLVLPSTFGGIPTMEDQRGLHATFSSVTSTSFSLPRRPPHVAHSLTSKCSTTGEASPPSFLPLHPQEQQRQQSDRSLSHLALHADCYCFYHNLPKIKSIHARAPLAVKVVDPFGRLSVHQACAKQASVDVIKFLVQCNPFALWHRDCEGSLPLHVACSVNASPPVEDCIVESSSMALQKQQEQEEEQAEAEIDEEEENKNEDKHVEEMVASSSPPPLFCKRDDAKGTVKITPEEQDEMILKSTNTTSRTSAPTGNKELERQDSSSSSSLTVKTSMSWFSSSCISSNISFTSTRERETTRTTSTHWSPLVVGCRQHISSLAITQFLVPDTKHVDKKKQVLLATPPSSVFFQQLNQKPSAKKKTKNKSTKLLVRESFYRGSLDVIKYLIEAYPQSMHVKDHEGHIPLQVACSSDASLDVLFHLLVQKPETLADAIAASPQQ